jgi:Protein of unknown function (DUF2752)
MPAAQPAPDVSDHQDSARPAPTPTSIPRPDPLYHTVFLVICVGVLFLSWLLSVREERQVLVPILATPLPELCMFKRMTGMGCPGCGMTRSFISLAHGNLRMAWHYNPAGPLLFAMLAFQIPFRLVQLARIRSGRTELRMGRWPQLFFGVLGVLLVGQWILRLFGITF